MKVRAFAYWGGIVPRVIVPSGDRVGVYTMGMVNYWRELIAAMVDFRNNGRGDISHLLQSCISPLPHPCLFVATNTMTTYVNHQRLGYAVWHQEESKWVIFDNHHPPLWLRDHPHIPVLEKVPSSKGRRTTPAGTPAAKKGIPADSRKEKLRARILLSKLRRKRKQVLLGAIEKC